MINGISWLVVTKLDVLDDLAEIPVCVGYKIGGKKSSEIPAHAAGYERIEPVYDTLRGWKKPTSGVTRFEKLPPQARAYLEFVAKETGARIAMVSTGPDREQTIFLDDFVAELNVQGRDKRKIHA